MIKPRIEHIDEEVTTITIPNQMVEMIWEAIGKMIVNEPQDGRCICGNIIGRSAYFCKTCGQRVRNYEPETEKRVLDQIRRNDD